MSEVSSSPEKTTVNIRITETFLSDVDAALESLGYKPVANSFATSFVTR